MNTQDMKLQIRTKLNNDLQADYSSANVYLGTTSDTDNFVVMQIEIFEQTDDNIKGQITCNIRFSNYMELLDVIDLVINSLHRYNYATANSSLWVWFAFDNDLSNYADIKYDHEVVFEFSGY